MLNLAIRIYYVAVPACMVLQTVLMLYGIAALKGINKKMGRNKKANDGR